MQHIPEVMYVKQSIGLHTWILYIHSHIHTDIQSYTYIDNYVHKHIHVIRQVYGYAKCLYTGHGDRFIDVYEHPYYYRSICRFVDIAFEKLDHTDCFFYTKLLYCCTLYLPPSDITFAIKRHAFRELRRSITRFLQVLPFSASGHTFRPTFNTRDVIKSFTEVPQSRVFSCSRLTTHPGRRKLETYRFPDEEKECRISRKGGRTERGPTSKQAVHKSAAERGDQQKAPTRRGSHTPGAERGLWVGWLVGWEDQIPVY